MSERGALIKFQKLEYLIQIRDEGLLYMNTLPYFWEIEDEDGRGDKNDGVDRITHGTRGDVVIPSGDKLTVTKWDMRMFRRPDADRINLLCMYALRPDAGTFPVDEKNYKLGDSALLIYKPDEFIRRVEVARDTQGLCCDANLVEYVPNDYIGEIGPFRKLQRFEYQSEWRMVCYEGPGAPRIVRIGSIADISRILPSNEVNGLDVGCACTNEKDP